MIVERNFWKGKKVFITGHSGFKGSWLSLWLISLGSEVKGYALKPTTSPSLFNETKIGTLVESDFGDIRDLDSLRKSINIFKPDIIFHMAAQPLVGFSYDHPVDTFNTNVMGTVNLLEVARNSSNLKAIINITSDKCYQNDGRKKGYKETDAMGGYDPYSSSKGCSELVTSAYRLSFLNGIGVGVASARAGNVIGGGDWTQGRLIPDILKSFDKKTSLVIRNPKATRPWQHVLEPLSGYLILAQNLYLNPTKYSEGWNFGPYVNDAMEVSWILEYMNNRMKSLDWEPFSGSSYHEASELTLNINKSVRELGWSPTWSLKTALDRIIEWHQEWIKKNNIQQICLSEIGIFQADFIVKDE
jgi:CDP-glucose 4,6-dehydratase